ncbi:MAG TPA: asparagine synthase-related protein, partial [Terriglobales bacterium]
EISELLMEPRTTGRGYFRTKEVERILAEHHESRRDHSAIIWQMLVFELWHRNYLGQVQAAVQPSLQGAGH